MMRRNKECRRAGRNGALPCHPRPLCRAGARRDHRRAKRDGGGGTMSEEGRQEDRNMAAAMPDMTCLLDAAATLDGEEGLSIRSVIFGCQQGLTPPPPRKRSPMQI